MASRWRRSEISSFEIEYSGDGGKTWIVSSRAAFLFPGNDVTPARSAIGMLQDEMRWRGDGRYRVAQRDGAERREVMRFEVLGSAVAGCLGEERG